MSDRLFLNFMVFHYGMLPKGTPKDSSKKCLIVLYAHYWLCFYMEAAIWNADFLHAFSFSGNAALMTRSHMNYSELPVMRTVKLILAKAIPKRTTNSTNTSPKPHICVWNFLSHIKCTSEKKRERKAYLF